MRSTATTNRLIRKPQRQLKLVVSQPPSSGPIAVDAPATPPHTPNAIARSRPRNLETSSDAVAGIMSAAPMPSMIDSPTMSMGTLVEIDAMKEPTPKSTAPNMNMRLRPNRSPRRPPVIVSAARVSE